VAHAKDLGCAAAETELISKRKGRGYGHFIVTKDGRLISAIDFRKAGHLQLHHMLAQAAPSLYDIRCVLRLLEIPHKGSQNLIPGRMKAGKN
jgi:hypothetical protein